MQLRKPGLIAALLAIGALANATPSVHADETDPGEDCNAALTPEIVAAMTGQAAEPVVDEAEVDVAAGEIELVPNVPPSEFQPGSGRDCHRYRGRRVCDGPRRIAVPTARAMANARAHNLGSKERAIELMRTGPTEALLALAGVARQDLMWPVANGRLWRGFGMVGRGRRRRLHKGLDIGAPQGSPIRAINDGIVVYADNGMNGYGNIMIVLHADGSFSSYAHCRAAYVTAGEQVRRGQLIGEVGETGLARGAHCHFEFRRGGNVRNSLPLFSSRPHVGDPAVDRSAEEALGFPPSEP